MKRYFTYIIIFLLLFISKEYLLSYNNTQNPIQISNASDIIQLSSSTIDWNKNFIQTANINLGGATIAPIGNYVETGFTGNFNGQNHTISNFIVSSTLSDEAFGLFGYADGGNLININISNFNITNSTGHNNSIASLCGYIEGGTIINCHASLGTITGNTSSGGSSAGGLIGGTDYSTISYCSVVNITITSYEAGGLIYWSNSHNTISNCFASYITLNIIYASGGFLTNSENDMITNCYVTNFTMTGSDNELGGFAGGDNETSTFTNCYSSGTITITNSISGVGGFSGFSYRCNYYNCYSQVDISSTVSGHKDYYGGFVGFSEQDSFVYCKSLGNLTIVGEYGGGGGHSNHGGFVGYAYYSTFSEVYSSGSFNIEYEDKIGGFAGYLNNSQISNCYTQYSISGDNNQQIGGFVGYNDGSSLSYCYSAVSMSFTSSFEIGGFCGDDDGSVSYLCCFWDKDLITPAPADLGYHNFDLPNVYDCTTAEMKQAVTYLSHSCAWNFSNIWESHDGSDFPTLFFPTITPTPTLTEWSRYILIFSVLLFGCYFVYRKIYV